MRAEEPSWGDRVRVAREKHGLTRAFRRWVTRTRDRLLWSIDQQQIIEALRAIGIERGAVIVVHSALSQLGYVKGGAQGLIDALLEAVGPEGTVLMPSFPMTGSQREFLDSGVVFDVRSTPSRSGEVTEIFRRRPDVLRSLHPTNPVCGWGRYASEILRDHHRSLTAFGHETPYGRLAGRDDTFIVMLQTHIRSFQHHFEERVGLPTLFMPQVRTVPVIDETGNRREVQMRVRREYAPYFMAVPSAGWGPPEWAEIRDFLVIFPTGREAELRAQGMRFEGYPRFWRVNEELKQAGAFKHTRLGRGDVGALHVRPLLGVVEPEFRRLLERFRSYYDPEEINKLGRPTT